MEESGGDSVVREDPEGLQSQEEPISTGEESSVGLIVLRSLARRYGKQQLDFFLRMILLVLY